MTSPVPVDDWMRCIEADYFKEFIPDGGAAVKCAVALESEGAQDAARRLATMAAAANCLVAEVDARTTRVHMVEQVFFVVAQQAPWEELCLNVVKGIAKEHGYAWPAREGDSWYDSLAEANKTDAGIVRNELRQGLTKRVYKNAALAKDFRVAMLHMCLSVLSGGDEGRTAVGKLTEWLTGKNRTVGPVKAYHIYTGINRSNARHFLESLSRWTRLGGYAGILLILDIRRLALQRNPGDGHIFYSKAALLDAYELLRQCIDGTDRLEGVLLAVFGAPSFVDLDSPRGMGVYSALKTRVYDEVKDRKHANPAGALVRLATAS